MKVSLSIDYQSRSQIARHDPQCTNPRQVPPPHGSLSHQGKPSNSSHTYSHSLSLLLCPPHTHLHTPTHTHTRTPIHPHPHPAPIQAQTVDKDCSTEISKQQQRASSKLGRCAIIRPTEPWEVCVCVCVCVCAKCSVQRDNSKKSTEKDRDRGMIRHTHDTPVQSKLLTFNVASDLSDSSLLSSCLNLMFLKFKHGGISCSV